MPRPKMLRRLLAAVASTGHRAPRCPIGGARVEKSYFDSSLLHGRGDWRGIAGSASLRPPRHHPAGGQRRAALRGPFVEDQAGAVWRTRCAAWWQHPRGDLELPEALAASTSATTVLATSAPRAAGSRSEAGVTATRRARLSTSCRRAAHPESRDTAACRSRWGRSRTLVTPARCIPIRCSAAEIPVPERSGGDEARGLPRGHESATAGRETRQRDRCAIGGDSSPGARGCPTRSCRRSAAR